MWRDIKGTEPFGVGLKDHVGWREPGLVRSYPCCLFESICWIELVPVVPRGLGDGVGKSKIGKGVGLKLSSAEEHELGISPPSWFCFKVKSVCYYRDLLEMYLWSSCTTKT